MTAVTIDGETIRVSLEGMDKIWALKRELEIPLAHVRAAAVAPAGIKPWGIRAPGTSIPGRYRAGTWRGSGTKEFWNVRDDEKALVLDLDGDEYTRVVIETAEPNEVVAAIESAMDRISQIAGNER
jgi:hypothetical protein